jgi:hypothetical protein
MEQNIKNALPEEANSSEASSSRWKTWIKRVGVGGLIFFTVKGLVWLAVGFGLFRFIGCSEN